MKETKSVEIEGIRYELMQMGAVEGRRLSILFAQVCAVILPHLQKASVDTEALTALGAALSDIDPDKLEPLWKAFAQNAVAYPPGKTMVLGDPDVFDEHFRGDFMAMWKFFIESSKLNFGGFLEKLRQSSVAAEAPKL